MQSTPPLSPQRIFFAAKIVARVAFVTAILMVDPGCALGGNTIPSDPAVALVPRANPPHSVAGSYVGRVEGTNYPTLIAIHVLEPDASGEREVTVYICDSQVRGNIWWFRKRVRGYEFSLTSHSGEATVNVRLTPGSATGTVRADLPRDLVFRVHRAQAGEGIYTVTIGSNGQVAGDGWIGQGRLVGQYPGVGAAAIGPVHLTLVLPDGRRINFSEPSWQPSEPGSYRAVVDRSGRNLGVLGTKFLITTVRTSRSSPSDIIGLNMVNAR